MRPTSNPFLASVAALLLGCGLLGPSQPAAQDAEEKDQAGKEKPAQAAEAGRDVRTPPEMNTAPPKNLKLVGDHWTPYDPPDPESFPPEALLHIIVRGDTLWGMADLTFNNPYLWPQIWDQNRYILDSHWIYPGDPLLLPARPIVVTGTTPSTVPTEVVPQGPETAPPTAPRAAGTEEPAPGEPIQEPLAAEPPPETASGTGDAGGAESETAHAPRTVPKVVPLADETDIRCSGFIAARDSTPDYFIANQEEEAKTGVIEGDIVYLNRGTENGHVDPGTEYSVVVREGEVRHPINGRFLGFYYKRVGSVKLLAAQKRTAIAVISLSCDEIRTGYDVVPLRVVPQRAKPQPAFDRLAMVGNRDKLSGYVVHVVDNLSRVATGQIVDIDLGYDDGVQPGDYLTAFLPTEQHEHHSALKYRYVYDNRRMEAPVERYDDHLEFPARPIGQLMILSTERHTATAKIIHALREISVGTQVEVQ